MIGVVILNYNSYSLVLKLLENLKSISELSKIIIVDNNSTDNSIKELRKVVNNDILLIENKKNNGYASGNNTGIKFLIKNFPEINFISILNPDVFLEDKETFKKLKESLIKDKTLGIISPLMKLNGKVIKKMISWKAPEKFDNIFYCLGITKRIKDKLNMYKEKDVIPGSFLFFSKETIQKINYLDEGTFLYYEENILSKKLKNIGKVMRIISECSYNHLHSNERQNLKRKLFHNKIYFKSMIYYEENYNKGYKRINIPIIKILYYFRVLEIYFYNLIRRI